MILERQLPELTDYRKAEKSLPIVTNLPFSKVVVSDGNSEFPVHRWFRFKESFSANLLREVFAILGPTIGKKIRLLDPFCGVGTSLVAAQEMSASGYEIDAVGIEINPFIAFTADTKVRWREIDASLLVNLGERLLKRVEGLSPSIPPLSSLTTGRCVSRARSQRILAIRQAICEDGHSTSHKALLLGLASAIELVSRIRKDGRALRIIDRPRSRLHGVLKKKWAVIAEDAKFFQQTLGKAKVPRIIVGDGREPTSIGISEESIDLVLTSPPYPNNIDYSEVYKLELWLLGFVREQTSFLGLRKQTFRSHPTCQVPDHDPEFVETIRRGRLRALLKPLLGKCESIPEPWRKRVVLGYFSDMWVSLREQFNCLRKGGYSAIVVGNSLHGGADTPYLIPTDIVVAAMSERIGFQVEKVMVARALMRRLASNHFLRESVVILRKPNA